MEHLTGIIPVVVTPFAADGRIDHGSLERLVEDYCAGGIAGMMVPAVASEVDKLSGAERLEHINLHLLKRLCARKGLFRSAHLRPPFIPWDDYHERYAGELIDRMLSWETLARGDQAEGSQNNP